MKILQQKPRHEALTSLVNYCYSKFIEGQAQGRAERVALEERIKELEAALDAVREKLDLYTKLQPMDTAPDTFVGYVKEDDECLECHIVYRDGDGFDTNALMFIRKDMMIGWTPLPEGTEGL